MEAYDIVQVFSIKSIQIHIHKVKICEIQLIDKFIKIEIDENKQVKMYNI